MAFNGDEGEIVSLSDAKTWTEKYRNDNPGQVKAYFYGKNKLMDILNQTGCVGIRMYYGKDGSTPNIVLVGAESNEDDMQNGIIVEHGVPCPNQCGAPNELNS